MSMPQHLEARSGSTHEDMVFQELPPSGDYRQAHTHLDIVLPGREVLRRARAPFDARRSAHTVALMLAGALGFVLTVSLLTRLEVAHAPAVLVGMLVALVFALAAMFRIKSNELRDEFHWVPVMTPRQRLVVRDGHVIVHGMHLPLAHHPFESVHRDRQGWAIVTDDDPCTLTLLYALTIEEMEFVLMKLRDAA